MSSMKIMDKKMKTMSEGNRVKKVEQYQFLQILGKGANGLVYKGLNAFDGSLVAIKEMTLEKSDIKPIKAQLGFLQRLDHPSIVKYIDAIQNQNKIYLVLEYVEGGSLGALARRSQLDESVVKIYIKQVLTGLAFLHQEGVIHRDIKGANILIDKHGMVKLADFGVAIKIEEAQKTLSAAGSPYWMAPQVIIGQGQVTSKSDIWSLGCTIIELLTGNPPYYELMQFPAIFRIVQDKCPPIPPCSPQCKSFLISCFQKNPQNRPTAQQLQSHIWLQGAEKKQAESIKKSSQSIQKQLNEHLKSNVSFNELCQLLSEQPFKSHSYCLYKHPRFLEIAKQNSKPSAERLKLINRIMEIDSNSIEYLKVLGLLQNQGDIISQAWQTESALNLPIQYWLQLAKANEIFITRYCISCSLSLLDIILQIGFSSYIPFLLRIQKHLNKQQQFSKMLLFWMSKFITAVTAQQKQEQHSNFSSLLLAAMHSHGIFNQIVMSYLQTKEGAEIVLKLVPSLLQKTGYEEYIKDIARVLLACEIKCLSTEQITEKGENNEEIKVIRLLCMNGLCDCELGLAILEENGVIYFISAYIQRIFASSPRINMAALYEIIGIGVKLTANDKNRVKQFKRHGGYESLNNLAGMGYARDIGDKIKEFINILEAL